ncbi:MAG: carboxymuconolactone decarboxylase family protein [Novosphingobium sp.]|uniref:carboxymuconolactone decarboxylase family protein n=1 Tax=Novosphingobium sp. TaxID=1874826 RepID=UPI002734E321|nr:carboxymuconolactone decarboxylase family protein [Novosphingobium sp.]MDP3549246.1 carboxymuconolactone decarboxylase family protein [Novosphingobium sp.]
MTNDLRRSEGLKIRRQVVGEDRVRTSFDGADVLSRPLQELVTDFAWGEVWTRPGLDLRARSILTIGMLIALGKVDELAVHLRGGLNNGLTVTELQEMVLQSAVYAGFPAANQAIASLRKVVGELDADIR